MKRQLTEAERSGGRTHEGIIPSSFTTGNSGLAGGEPRTMPKTHSAASWDGMTCVVYASGGQHPEVIPFKVREDQL